MENEFRNEESMFKEFVTVLSVKKKKNAVAICLLLLMGVMWFRVFMSKSPEAANAMEVNGQTLEVEKLKSGELLTETTFIELPIVASRRKLSRNFFKLDRDRFQGDEKVKNEITYNFEKVDRRVLEHIRLDAISMGEEPQAFIDGKILTVGDKLIVEDGQNKYEFEIVIIEGERVSLRCRDLEVSLRLAETVVGF